MTSDFQMDKSALKNIVFFLKREADPLTQELMQEEIRDAVQILGQEGLHCSVVWAETETAGRPQERENTLCLVNDAALSGNGLPTAGYSYAGRTGSLSGLPYILEDPGWVDPDSWQKIWERLNGLPWHILETGRCIVREFTAEDADAIGALYDQEARRYLEAPPKDSTQRRQILDTYIRKIYGLYGFGYWAVLDRTNGELIGRIGYALPTAEEEREYRCDATFGYLMRRDRRGCGLACEVCEALLQYGFSQLGFRTIRADTSRRNIASQALLRKLGFERVLETADKYIYSKEEKLS